MARTPRLHAFTVFGLALALAGCGGGEPGDTEPSSGLDAPDRDLPVMVTPVHAVGGMQAPEWAEFGSVSSVAFDGSGNLYILDGQAQQVTVVGPDGSFLRTVGSPGEGPGELGSPSTMVVHPDGRVAIFDFGHQGWVVYDAEGAFVRNIRVDVSELGIPGRDAVVHPDGSIVASIQGRIRFGPGGADPDTLPPSRPIARFPLEEGTDGEVVYRAWDMPEPEQEGETRTMGGSGGTFTLAIAPQRAFEPGLHVGVLPDGRIAVADSVTYAIKLLGPEGALTGRLERPVAPTLVTPDIEDAERQRRLDALAAEGGSGGPLIGLAGGGRVSVDPGAMREMRENMIASLLFAAEIPVIEDVAVDPEGRLWVQRSSGQPGVDGPTDLITADGRYLGTIPADGLRIPDAFGPDGLIARIETDDFDVPTVVVERLPADPIT